MTLYLLFIAGADNNTKTGLTYDTYVAYEGPVPAGATSVCASLNIQYKDDNNNIRYAEGCVPAEPGYQKLLIRIPLRGLVHVIGYVPFGPLIEYFWLTPYAPKSPAYVQVPRVSYCNIGSFNRIVRSFTGNLTASILTCSDEKCYWLVRYLKLVVDEIDDGAVVTARILAAPRGWSHYEGVTVARVARGSVGVSRYGPLEGVAILGFGSPGTTLYLDVSVEGGFARGSVELEYAGPFYHEPEVIYMRETVTLNVYAIDESGNRTDLASADVYWGLHVDYCFRDVEQYSFDGWLVKPQQG